MAKFENVVRSARPVIVDFYTDWCGPCKQVPPILKEIKQELKERVRIIKVNVDKNPHIATKYQIRNLPTIMVFKEGEVKWTTMGVPPAGEIKQIVQNHL
jgi:thioredoxin 1